MFYRSLLIFQSGSYEEEAQLITYKAYFSFGTSKITHWHRPLSHLHFIASPYRVLAAVNMCMQVTPHEECVKCFLQNAHSYTSARGCTPTYVVLGLFTHCYAMLIWYICYSNIHMYVFPLMNRHSQIHYKMRPNVLELIWLHLQTSIQVDSGTVVYFSAITVKISYLGKLFKIVSFQNTRSIQS